MSQPRGKFLQVLLVLVVAFLLFRYGIQPPMPFSVLSLYMAVTLMAMLVYVSSDSDSWRAFVAVIWATLTDPDRRGVRLLLTIALPLLVGYYAYSQAAAKIEAPLELRAVHPAPPDSISFRGKEINLQASDTPIRKDITQTPANRAKHLTAGGAIYVRNCMYCHGDHLDGRGHFAHGLNPAPADFVGPNPIAQLSEGFVFWRIAKGGPGLPKESTPWNSAMPAWEDRLTEEQIWQVIYYLYETTGHPPRRMDAHAAAPRPAPAPAPADAWDRLVGVRAAGAQASAPAPGKGLYDKHCALCHGVEGKGDGPGAELLLPRPRDFTAGKYKIRTTLQLPSDEDLVRVIAKGMPGTSMPAWEGALKPAEIQAVVAYLKTFAPAFKDGKVEVAKVPPEVKADEASLKRGKEMFEAIECHKCHGQAGRGDPAPGSDLKDDWGHPVRPANLTKPWTFRGGHERKDVAARLSTGLLGSPMPTFLDSVEKPEDIWHLANYVRSLGADQPGWASVLGVHAAAGEVPSDPDAPFWQGIPAASFPLVGQVIADPRAFNPTVDLVSVRAVHTPQEVVFHLTWDDPTSSDPSKGAPKPDRIALQLPGPGATERPYFLMGEGGKPVTLLTWQAGAGAGEATAEGVGKVTPQAAAQVATKAQAVYDAGQYRVVLRRPLQTGDATDFVFTPGQFFPIAFWAWDGSEGEEGPKAAVSTWYYARLEAPPSKRQFVVPPLAVLGTVILELGVLRWARARRRPAA
jgi:DMSO reductase family type II enzyme heme b subunit